MCADSLLICFIAVEIVKTNLNTPIWKAWGSATRAQRPLPTGIVRRQFPSLRGTTWRNKGRSAWNGSRFEHICAFYVEITNIQGVKLKMSCYNRDWDRSVGVCCPSALGLVRTAQQTHNLNVTFPESPLKVSSLWTYFGHFGDVRIKYVKAVLSHNVL